ncbi:unnamed protein product [Debaryomyces tyrocola]|nr:unnamed protein product [Debaryomyces tyrocola]
MAKLVRHLTSNEEIVSSNLAEGIIFCYIFAVKIARAFPGCSLAYFAVRTN